MAEKGMKCPKCGGTMNKHAAKLREPHASDEMPIVIDALGGVLEEFHTCPSCGMAAWRTVGSGVN